MKKSDVSTQVLAYRDNTDVYSNVFSTRDMFQGRNRNSLAFVAIILLAILFCLLAAPTYAQETRVEWTQLGELPDGSGGEGQPHNLGVAGPFVGVHNDALIVAGGANFPIPREHKLWDRQTRKIYHQRIWVATRGPGTDRNGDGEISENELSLNWHDSQIKLPVNLAYGASASHEIGVFAIGGSDGSKNYSDVHLLRWNAVSKQPELFTLPPMPRVSINGGAAVIGNTLYVMAGSDGYKETSELYSFDISSIETDSRGNPLATNGVINISGQPWQKLASLTQLHGDNLARTHMTVVAQNNGYGDRLYVIGGRRYTTLDQHPNAIPVSLGDNRSYLHFYSDVWAFDPEAKVAENYWTRRADIKVDGQPMGLSAGSGIALGQSHILLLAGSNGANLHKAFGDMAVNWRDYPNHPGFHRQALSYNAITDSWTSYNDAPLIADPMGEEGHKVAANAVTTTAVKWGDSIIMASGEVRPKVRTAKIWSIKVIGSEVSFGWENMTVLVIYLFSMVLVGMYFMFKNNSTDDYFRGGQNIPWWAAACSIYATMLSSLTYIALPALVYQTNWLLYLGIAMMFVVTPVAVYVVMPFFRQINATSAYEYLSKRFNMTVRLFASGLFSLFHISRMGIVMALTALALSAVTPLESWQCVLLIGVLCLIYCTLGGIEAVIWADTIQTVVLLAGALLCFVYIVSGVDGGFSGFIEQGMAADKFQMVSLDFSLDSITTLSIWVIVLGGIGQNLSSYSADQAVVQRYMTTKDTRSAAKSLWGNVVMALPGSLLFFGIGTGLYCFYRSNPGKLDPTLQLDQIFPTFIATELPIGIAGLIVAGIFAAAQSTVSTSMNSIATTLITDFMRPFNACRSEKAYLNAARGLTFLMGLLGTLAGLLFISPEIRSLMAEYFKVIGMFMGALGGLFILGMTTRKANSYGAMIGLLVGVTVMIIVWLMQWADGYLFATIGISVCWLIGYLASFFLPSDNKDLTGLTLYTMFDTQVKNTDNRLHAHDDVVASP